MKRFLQSLVIGGFVFGGFAGNGAAQVRVQQSVTVTPQGQTAFSETASLMLTPPVMNVFGEGTNHAVSNATADLSACALAAGAHGCNTVTEGLFVGGDVGAASASLPFGESYRLDKPGAPMGTVVMVTFTTSVVARTSSARSIPGAPGWATGQIVASRAIIGPGGVALVSDTGMRYQSSGDNGADTGTLSLDDASENTVSIPMSVGTTYLMYMSVTAEATANEVFGSSTGNARVSMTWGATLPSGAVLVNTRTGEPMCGGSNTAPGVALGKLPPPLVQDPCLFSIVMYPEPVIACPSTSAEMTTVAAAPPSGQPITYRWEIRYGRGVWVPMNDGTLIVNGRTLGVVSGATASVWHIELGSDARGEYELRCVTTNPCGRLWTPPTRLTIAPGDVGVQGGQPGQDGMYDNNDFVAFITHFFNGDPEADIGAQGGLLRSDTHFDNNDFVVFIDQFFSGC